MAERNRLPPLTRGKRNYYFKGKDRSGVALVHLDPHLNTHLLTETETKLKSKVCALYSTNRDVDEGNTFKMYF